MPVQNNTNVKIPKNLYNDATGTLRFLTFRIEIENLRGNNSDSSF